MRLLQHASSGDVGAILQQRGLNGYPALRTGRAIYTMVQK
jgi:hypothetical protein